MDLTGGLFLVTSQTDKPRILLNMHQDDNNISVTNLKRVSIEISGNPTDKTLINTVEWIRTLKSVDRTKWEICSPTGEVLEDNTSRNNQKLTYKEINNLLEKIDSIYNEIHINYTFLHVKEIFKGVNEPQIFQKEVLIKQLVERQPKKGIQTKTILMEKEFKNIPKKEILILLNSMIEKQILDRRGSWYYLR